jgi:hypothetical protein
MHAKKKPSKATARVKFKDIKPGNNPKGGGSNSFVQVGGITGDAGSSGPASSNPTIPLISTIKVPNRVTLI